MTPNWVIFLVGAFVTITWGAGIAALLYAALNPAKRLNTGRDVEPESDYRRPKESNQ